MQISEDEAQQWLQQNCGFCVHVGDRLWIDVQCPVARAIVWYVDGFSDTVLAKFHAYGYPGQCARFLLDKDKVADRERWREEEVKQAARKRPWLEQKSAE